MGAVYRPLFKKSCIIGLGLLGGSLGMALGRYGIVEERWGNDLSMEVMEEAKEKKAVDHTAGLKEALHGADLVVLSIPVLETSRMLKKIAPLLERGALVTDLGSSKKEITSSMEKYLPPGTMAVGGHPMAGSEQTGIAAADPFLFENAIYLLTPTPGTPPEAVERLKKMIIGIKAHPLTMDPDEHDRLVALISHLPHFIATALVNTVTNFGDKEGLLAMLAGNGFKDTTRIAMGNPDVWYDIFVSNKKYLRQSLDAFRENLSCFMDCLERGNKKEAYRIMQEARSYRRSL
ncbi:MAG: prephenate dehydrogenase [Dethiobacteria bacterium]